MVASVILNCVLAFAVFVLCFLLTQQKIRYSKLEVSIAKVIGDLCRKVGNYNDDASDLIVVESKDAILQLIGEFGQAMYKRGYAEGYHKGVIGGNP